MIILFNNLTNKDKTNAVESLIKHSTPNQDFFLMVILSILTATFGLLLNSSPIIIGSMLIAPILFPILSLSLGISISDAKLISRSTYTIFKSLVFGVFASTTATALFANHFNEVTPEIISRTLPNLPYLMVAIIAGLAASFALVKPQLNETLPGIAISVALIPPIAATGIGIAKLNWSVISGSFLLFTVNAMGIIFASMFTFSLMNFYVKRKEAREVAIKEDKKIEKEKKIIENKLQKQS